MSENSNKSITPSDGSKAEASKAGWLLKWTNYLKGKSAPVASSQQADGYIFRLSKALVRAVEWSLVILQVSVFFLLSH